uniref:Uncharacterized protein n=1 Tax=Panagrolaimus sp. PS1159 TaxID=55785 RepID=A0AC35FER4_9BILA
MKLEIIFLFAIFVFANGIFDGDRKIRAADFQTDQLEDKLLRSNLQTFNGRTDAVSMAQNEQVIYGIGGTFVFKVQTGNGQNVARISPANNPPRLANIPQQRSSLERE